MKRSCCYFIFISHLFFLLCLFLLCFVSLASAASPESTALMTKMQQTINPYAFGSSIDAKRFHTLLNETRCVVCQNQTIADSNAPLANDLREKIYVMIINKKSDKEIKDYLVRRYGEFILLKPRFNHKTLLLWSFPFFGIAFAFLNLFLWAKKIKFPA